MAKKAFLMAYINTEFFLSFFLSLSLSLSLSFFLYQLFILPNEGLTPPGSCNPKCMQRKHGLWTRALGSNTRAGLPAICGQQNVRATARNKTGQNTDKGHISSPRIEIKIPEPAGNLTRAPNLEGRDSTDLARAMDDIEFLEKLIKNGSFLIKNNIK